MSSSYDLMLQDISVAEICYNGPRKGVDEIIRLLGDQTESRILDVGAGTGLIGAMVCLSVCLSVCLFNLRICA